MKSVPQVIILILEVIHLIFGVFGIPIYRMSKGGKLLPNILLCWGVYILWAVIWCIILPAIFYHSAKIYFYYFQRPLVCL